MQELLWCFVPQLRTDIAFIRLNFSCFIALLNMTMSIATLIKLKLFMKQFISYFITKDLSIGKCWVFKYIKSYGGWRRAVFIALSAKNKLGFIDGSITETTTCSPSFKAWNRCNDMVISWLLNHSPKKLLRAFSIQKLPKKYGRRWRTGLGREMELSFINCKRNLVTQFKEILMLLDTTLSSKESRMNQIVLIPVSIAVVNALVEERTDLSNLNKMVGSFSFS